jgi:hypothetical protein
VAWRMLYAGCQRFAGTVAPDQCGPVSYSYISVVCYPNTAFRVDLTNPGRIRVAAREDIRGIIRATYLHTIVYDGKLYIT